MGSSEKMSNSMDENLHDSPRNDPYLIPIVKYNKVALDWSNADGGKEAEGWKMEAGEEEDRILIVVILVKNSK